ncbi:complement component receptor 1-like protein [Tubulanus polymorphus]|uniref:complement component receptor 1-like protein n=1 Tax=Tubulanus polymorphus TaxID=672921 RepID=UPI003DA1CE38
MESYTLYFILVVWNWCKLSVVNCEFRLLQTPNYPNPYPLDSEPYIRQLKTENEYGIKVNVTDVELRKYDKLRIVDDDASTFLMDATIRYYTAERKYKFADVFFLDTNRITIELSRRMWPDENRRGYRMEISKYLICGGAYPLQWNTGDIISPGFPNDYSAKEKNSCYWHVNAKKGQSVKYTIEYFDLSPIFKQDYLEIQGVLDEEGNKLVLTYAKPPKRITYYSKDFETHVKFYSARNTNNYKKHKGFWLSFKVVGCTENDIKIGQKSEIINNASFYYSGYVLKYECQKGFQFPNREIEHYLTCDEAQFWIGLSVDCVEITCGQPERPADADISNKTEGKFNVGDEIQYFCKTGILSGGDSLRTCLGNGTWSGLAPKCINESFISRSCENPGDPIDGSLIGRNFSVGSKVYYECIKGHRLVGKADSICLENSTWSDEKPKCIPVSCSVLLDPENGVVSVDGTSFGNLATYECLPGFRLNGSRAVQCSFTGTWSQKAPTCEQFKCPTADVNAYSQVLYSGKRFGDKAVYSCDTGYELSGLRQRLCLEDGTWEGEPPLCLAFHEVAKQVGQEHHTSRSKEPAEIVLYAGIAALVTVILSAVAVHIHYRRKEVRRSKRECYEINAGVFHPECVDNTLNTSEDIDTSNPRQEIRDGERFNEQLT